MSFEMLPPYLTWWPELGYGYYPVQDQPYDLEYFNKYVQYRKTELGHELNLQRVELVTKYTDEEVLDIGIGAGHFVDLHGNAKGFDVNKEGVKWLKDRGLYANPYFKQWNMTFWDSFEHIQNLDSVVGCIKEYAFLSIPIFESSVHVLRSRHYRKDEHYWYFTQPGLIEWFKKRGFQHLETSDFETQLGREDILSFVFRRYK